MTTLTQRGPTLFADHDDRADYGLRQAPRVLTGGELTPREHTEGSLLAASEVIHHLTHLDFPHLSSPQLGDPIAIDLMHAVNGDAPFCDRCGRVKAGGRTMADKLRVVGRRCGCGGHYLPGAAMEAEWRGGRA